MTRNNGGPVHPVRRQAAKAHTPDPSLTGSPSPSAEQLAAADGSSSTRTSHRRLVDREGHDRASVAQAAALLLAHPCKTAGQALVQTTLPPRPAATAAAGPAARQSAPEAWRQETRRTRRLPGKPMQRSDCKYAYSRSGRTQQLIRDATTQPRTLLAHAASLVARSVSSRSSPGRAAAQSELHDVRLYMPEA